MARTKVSEDDIVEYIRTHITVKWSDLTEEFGMSKKGIENKLKRHVRLSSLNHNSKYFTLLQFVENPDKNGIWDYCGVRFSIHGRGPETIKHLVDNSEMGLKRQDIDSLLDIVSNTHLLKLTKKEEMVRLSYGHDYVYFSKVKSIRDEQIEKRKNVEGFDGVSELEITEPDEEKRSEIPSILDLNPDDYVLRRLEMVRRLKNGESKIQIAREMDCSPDTVRKACVVFEKEGVKGLIITRDRKTTKLEDSVKVEILLERAKHPDWTPEITGEVLRKRRIDISDETVRTFLEEVNLENTIVPIKKTRQRP